MSIPLSCTPQRQAVLEADGQLRGTVYRLGPVTVEDWRIAGNYRLLPHAHETLHACVVMAGAFEEKVDHGVALRERSAIRVDPPGASHDIRFGPEAARCIVFEMNSDDDVRGLAPARSVAVRARTLRDAVERIVAGIEAGDQLAPLTAECAVIEVFAQAIRRGSLRRAGAPPQWLCRVREQVGERPDARVDLGALARDAGVHRVTLARAFREHYGMSVGAAARRMRLERARQELVHGRTPLAIVAANNGFVDQSHLHRSVVRAFGVTPGALRAASGR